MNRDNSRKFRRWLCLTVLMALLCVTACGDVNDDESRRTGDFDLAAVTSKVSGTTVQVAEPLTLELTVTALAGSRVDFLSIGKSRGNFDVTEQIDRADVPTANDVNQRVWTRRLTLESIVIGDMEIPALEILVRNRASAQTLKSDAIPVRVTSVLEDRADPTQFRDIRSVVDIEIPQPASRAWLWWTLSGIGGVATAAVLFMAVTKRKTWMTPNAWAIRELEDLRNSDAMKSIDSDTVIENLTTILRDYLELQFDIAATRRTSANGRRSKSRSTVIQYLITPRREGKFEIPPISFKVDGSRVTTEKLHFVATKSETGNLLFVEIEGGRNNVVVGQSLEMTLKIWIKPFQDAEKNITLSEANMWQMVSEQTSWGSFLDRTKELATNNQRPGGRSPISQMMGDDFFSSPFGNRLAVTSTRPITGDANVDATEVLPVPTEGRPADYRGAVGRYNIVTQATPTAVKVGDSITLNIGIVGTGPMELVQAPPLSELPTVLPNHSFHNHPQATAIGGGSS